jgi:hypothetical protein
MFGQPIVTQAAAATAPIPKFVSPGCTL